MNFLDATNQVLRRLRERTVGSVTENDYSILVGILLNDAKDEVEAAWNWSGLRNTITISTTEGVFAYELQGSNESSTILSVYNDTKDITMEYRTADQFNEWYLKGTPPSGSPTYYSFNGLSSDGDTQMEVYPIPTATTEAIRVNYLARGEDLLLGSESFKVASRPIVLLAYAKAVEERGEDGGVGSSPAYAMARRSLNDMISLDAGRHPEELVWEAV